MIQNRVGVKSAGNVPSNPSSNRRCEVTSIGTQTSWSLEPVESYFFMKNSDSVFSILDPSIAETIRYFISQFFKKLFFMDLIFEKNPLWILLRF